jgi:sarcosine oxidase subunit alpha
VIRDSVRIKHHPILNFKRGEKIIFKFNGRPVSAYAGETVAAALYASGIRIFSRSMKYHRPRGLFCLSGHCSHCLMRIDGIPNVPACKTRVSDNMTVESQNAWPSLKFDVANFADKLGGLLRPGFYYRYFIRPRWLYHIWERFLRSAAGIGKLPDSPEKPVPVKRKQASPPVVVVGAGVAGMNAALHASNTGAEVWLIEKEDKPGGRWLYDTRALDTSENFSKKHAHELVTELSEKLGRHDHCHFFKNTTAFAFYEEGVLAAIGPREFWEFEPQCTVIATGGYETPAVFENNDLPGIFLAGGIQRLMHGDGILPGKRAVIVTHNNEGYIVAKQLHEAGVSVAAVVDSRMSSASDSCMEKEYISNIGSALFFSHEIKSAIGRSFVKGAVLRPLKTSGEHDHQKNEVKIICDTICIAGFRSPANDLLFQHGCNGTYTLSCPQHYIRKPDLHSHMAVSEGLYAAGEASGSHGIKQAYLEGKLAGLAAANHLGFGDHATKAQIKNTENELQSLKHEF